MRFIVCLEKLLLVGSKHRNGANMQNISVDTLIHMMKFRIKINKNIYLYEGKFFIQVWHTLDRKALNAIKPVNPK